MTRDLNPRLLLRILPAAFLFSLLAACGKSPSPSSPSIQGPRPLRSDTRPDLLLLSIDSYRADDVGDGHRGSPTESLDQLALQGIWFEEAYSLAPLSLASCGTILTGRPAESLGLAFPGGTLRPDSPTLASLLSTAGYETAAAVSSRRVGRTAGLERGFGRFDEPGTQTLDREPQETADAAVKMLGGDASKPLFIWVHLTNRFESTDEKKTTEQQMAYQAGLQRVDRATADILQAFAFRRSPARAVVVAGTYGTELGEHGLVGNGKTLFESAVRVPLILVMPGFGAIRSNVRASHLDVLPTLAAIAGIRVPEGLPGRRLDELATLTGPLDRPLILESRLPEALGEGARVIGFRKGDWKLVEQGETGWLFNLRDDREEIRNLRSTRPLEWTRLKQEREELQKNLLRPFGENTVPGADAARLRSLGYLP